MLEEYPDVLTVPEIREILYIGRNKANQLLDFVERTKGNATEGKRKQPLGKKPRRW